MNKGTENAIVVSVPSDCQKTFRRCRRGRGPSDFHSCKPALPASRVVDFACKINSLEIGRPLASPNLLPRKSGICHFFDTEGTENAIVVSVPLFYGIRKPIILGGCRLFLRLKLLRQRWKLVQPADTKMVKKFIRGTKEDWMTYGILAPHFFNQPFLRQGCQGIVTFHPANLFHLGPGYRLAVATTARVSMAAWLRLCF